MQWTDTTSTQAQIDQVKTDWKWKNARTSIQNAFFTDQMVDIPRLGAEWR